MIARFCNDYNTNINEIDKNCHEMEMNRDQYVVFCRIQDFYNKYNANQYILSKLSGIPQSTISYIQTGKTRTGKSIQKLNDFLCNYGKVQPKTTFYSRIMNFFKF